MILKCSLIDNNYRTAFFIHTKDIYRFIFVSFVEDHFIFFPLNVSGVSQLVMTGIVTNQCVESAVRDAADRGFLVTLVQDACATHSQNDHDQSLKNMKGFSRIVSTDQLIKEIESL